MITLSINNIIVTVKKNSTILQACVTNGIQISKFCFHERLLIAGNCRICLVEVNKSPKPVAACAIPVSLGIDVFTISPLVRKAKENVLEFLLINHPLDCPICDQGGECDLQEQGFMFSSDRTRAFRKFKRSVSFKSWGPLIKTVITRCIHCTRCLRFFNDYSNTGTLGLLGRTFQSEISFFFNKKATVFFSGNVTDLCPVTSLTTKFYKCCLTCLKLLLLSFLF